MSKYTTEIDFSIDTSLSIIAKKISQGSSVLEFGPATGYLTKYLNEVLNCTVTAIEIDPIAAKKAEPYCKKMIVGNIDTFPWDTELANEKFDFIIYSDVLEHLYDPWVALKKSTNFLKDSGSIITSIPNIAHSAIILELLRGNFDYNNVGLLDNTHIRFFTKKTITKMFIEAGLKPIEWAYTKCSPANSEFKIHYETLPTQIADFMKKRTDGEIYQYITIAKKSEVAEQIEAKDILTHGFDRPILSIWFIKADSNLQGDPLEIRLKESTGWNTYSLKINIQEITKFGIKPTNQPALCEIKNILLKKDNRSLLVDLKSFELHKALRLKAENEDSIKFISFGETSLHFLNSLDKESFEEIIFDFKITLDLSDVLKETNSILSYIQPTNSDFYPDIMNSYANKINCLKYDYDQKISEISILKAEIIRQKNNILNIVFNKLKRLLKKTS